MHKLIGGLALLVLVGAGSSAHADGPWCAFYDASTYNCGFYSFEQCYETVRGAGGSCRPNFFQNFGDGRPAGRRVKPGRRKCPPLDIGSPPYRKARPCSIEHVMEALANGPSSQPWIIWSDRSPCHSIGRSNRNRQ